MKASNRCLLFLLVKLRGALSEKRNNLQLVCFEERMIGHATLIYLSVALQVRLMCFPMTYVSLKVRLTAISSLGKGDSALKFELTCPMEENFEKWHVIKKEKYDNEISLEAAKNG